MSLEDFQLTDVSSIHTSIIKRDYLKTYHQQEAQLNDIIQGTDFLFVENNNYHQIGNAYFDFVATLRKNRIDINNLDADGNVGEPISLVIIIFAYSFSRATLLTTGGEEIDQNKNFANVSTIMRLLTSKDGDLLACLDTNDASQNGIIRSSLSKVFIDNHNVVANRGKFKGHHPSNIFLEFVKHLKVLQKA